MLDITTDSQSRSHEPLPHHCTHVIRALLPKTGRGVEGGQYNVLHCRFATVQTPILLPGPTAY